MVKKALIFTCIFSFALSLNLFAGERQGAQIMVLNKEGGSESGELIAVKADSLLLLSSEGRDVTVDIEQVDVIRIIKKSKWLLGAGIGGTVGALGGALLLNDIWYEEYGEKTKNEAALQSGIFFGGLGLVLGGLTGAYAGQDKVYNVAAFQESEVKVMLKKLAKQARITDYQ